MSNTLKASLAAIGLLVAGLVEKHTQNRLDNETFAAEAKSITDAIEQLQNDPQASIAGELVEGQPLYDFSKLNDAFTQLAKEQNEIIDLLKDESALRLEEAKKLDTTFAELKGILQAIAAQLDKQPQPETAATDDKAAADAGGDLLGKGKEKPKAA